MASGAWVSLLVHFVGILKHGLSPVDSDAVALWELGDVVVSARQVGHDLDVLQLVMVPPLSFSMYAPAVSDPCCACISSSSLQHSWHRLSLLLAATTILYKLIVLGLQRFEHNIHFMPYTVDSSVNWLCQAVACVLTSCHALINSIMLLSLAQDIAI